MKDKWILISAIIQVVLGIAAIISFIILAIDGENMTKWIFTLILAIVLVVSGIIGLTIYKSNK